TKTPTASAAMTEPIHRLNISWLCSVMPPCGQPNAKASSIEQPLASPTVAAPTAARPITRRSVREPLATTRSCLLVLPRSTLAPPAHSRPGLPRRDRGWSARQHKALGGGNGPAKDRGQAAGLAPRSSRPLDPAYFDAATAAPLHPAARQALAAAVDDGWADPT